MTYYLRILKIFLTFLFFIVFSFEVFAQNKKEINSTKPIENILKPDGSIKRDARGSFSVDGMQLMTKPGEQPRLLRKNPNSIFSNGTNADVHAVAVDGSGNIYIGGYFTTVGGISANHIAKWDGANWTPLGVGVNAVVRKIFVNGSDIYAGGDFTTAGGISANHIAKWNGTTWDSLGSGVNGIVFAIALFGTDIIAGGDFTIAGGITANYIAKWNGTAWDSLSSGVNNQVYQVQISGSDVYVGGWFTTAGGIAANYIAKWNGTVWDSINNGLNNRVYGMAINGSDVYVGGNLTMAGGSSANHVAKWNGTSWSALGTGLDNDVLSIAILGSDVYVVGSFSNAGGSSATCIAKWDGANWYAVGTGLNNGGITIMTSGSDVYAGGSFLAAGGRIMNHIGRWNGSNWNPLSTITLSAPNGSESWNVGSKQSITWSTTSIDSVNILLTTNNGSSWSTITSSCSGSGGSYSWLVPNMPSTNCKIRVMDKDDSLTADTSNSTFTITTPSITVTAPNGGESWSAGTQHNITWTSSNVDSVKILYKTHPDSIWKTIKDTNASAGSFAWWIPAGASSNCKVSVAIKDIPSVSDSSNNVFTIISGPILNPPALQVPVSNAAMIKRTPKLQWDTTGTNAAKYNYVISTTYGLFPPVIYDSTAINVDTVTPAVILNYNTKYYWTVRSRSGMDSSSWAPVDSFTTEFQGPALLTPSNGQTNRPTSDSLKWSSVALATNGYRLQISTVANFATAFKDTILTSITDTSKYVTGMAPSTTYYWHVRAIKTVGDSSAWSTTWTFMTNAGTLNPPTLLGPISNAVMIKRTPKLQWDTTGTNAAKYNYVISTTYGLFPPVIYDSTAINVDTVTPAVILNYNTKYYWTVRSRSGMDSSSWAPVDSFTTEFQGPALLTPSNGQTNRPTSDSLKWSSVALATNGYRLQISTVANFATAFKDTILTSITDTSKYVTGMAPSTTYYWHVRAIKTVGDSSAWSTTWTFMTNAGTLNPPTLLGPISNAVMIKRTPKLQWDTTGTNAAKYNYVISTTYGLFPPVIYDSTAINVDTVTPAVILNYNTKYYWTVRSRSGMDSSSWAPVDSFTTEFQGPALLTPSNGQTNRPTSDSLKWSSVALATNGYRLQISTAANFATAFKDTILASITDTSKYVTGMAPSTTYYWHVRAIKTVGDSSAWSQTWSFVTSGGGGLNPPSYVHYPSNGNKMFPINPQLKWDTVGTNAAKYGYQISTDSTFATFVNGVNDSTSIMVDTVQVSGLIWDTKYYIRVRSSNGIGSVSSWTAKDSFYTAIQFPNLLYPAMSATGISLTDSLKWSKVTAAASGYRLQLSTVPNFTSVFKDTTVSSVNDTVYHMWGMVISTQYYWRVQGIKSVGDSSFSSGTRSFTTTGGAGTITVVSPNGGENWTVGSIKSIKWTSSGVTKVHIEYSTNGGNSYTMLQANTPTFGVDSIPWKVPNFPSGNCKIRITDTSNVSVADSSNAVFTVPTPALSITYPNGGQSLYIGTGINISWTASNVDTVIFGYSTNNGATWEKIRDTIASAGNLPWVIPAKPTSNALLKVAIKHDTTVFAQSASIFTIKLMPPTLLAPANMATNVPLNPALSWNPSNGAGSYRVQVLRDTTIPIIVKDTSGIAGNAVNIPGLQSDSSYYWRVMAISGADSSAFSAYRKFTIAPAPPGTPVLTSPVSGATGVKINPKLDWNVVAGAVKYNYQLSTNPGFTPLIVNDSTVVDSTFIAGLATYTTYYWRVNAANVGGIGAWAVDSFTTQIAAPNLTYPNDFATGLNTWDTLRWNFVPGATSYRLQVTSDTTGNWITRFKDTVTSLNWVYVSGMTNNTTYFWRVKSQLGPDSNNWSAARQFMVAPLNLTPPNLIIPPNFANNVNFYDTLKWNILAGAAAYRVQIAFDTGFTNIVLNDSINTNSKGFGPLLGDTVFYWRVRGSNATIGPWSAVWQFRTRPPIPAAPSLVTPVNGAVNVAAKPTLGWNPVQYANKYVIEVAKDPSFSFVVFRDSNVTGTARLVDSLMSDSLYYWHVAAINASGVSPWSNLWNFRVIQGLPAAPILLYPPNFAMNIPLTDTLRWNPVAGAAMYRLQFANDSGFTSIMIDDSSITENKKVIGPLLNGKAHFWRVLARNGAGAGPWSEVRKFTTILGALSQPVLLAPFDMSSNIPLNPVLRWLPVNSAQNYKLQVSTDSLFGSMVIEDSTLTDTSKIIGTLLNNTKYWWRVQPRNSMQIGPWSVVWKFSTVPLPPLAPILIRPVDMAVNVPLNDTLRWNVVNGATSYILQVSTDSIFNMLMINDTLPGTSKLIGPLNNNMKYFWRVQSKNPGGISPWSAVWTFNTTPFAPAAPALMYPPDMMANVRSKDTLRWMPVPGAVAYHLQLSLDSLFIGKIIDDSSMAGTFRFLDTLYPDSKYYWRVRSKNTGGISPWSATWRFMTTPAIPLSPVLISPTDMAQNVPTVEILRWNPVAGAFGYRLQLSTDSLFMNRILDDSLSGTSKLIGPLQFNMKHFWRVHAINISGPGFWSPVWRFTTVPQAPVASPILLYPPNNAAGIPIFDTLRWTPVPTAAVYRLQVSRDSLFGSLEIDDSTILGTARLIGPLNYDTVYFWRVSSKNIGGRGPWSGVNRFKTALPMPVSPILVYPQMGAGNIPLVDTLRWNPSAGAIFYRVQLSLDSAFSAIILDDSSLNNTKRTIGPLNGNARYFWRVNARNLTGVSPWSEGRSFTTLPGTPAIPVLLMPPDNTPNMPVLLTLSWNIAAGANVYRLQVANDSLFNSKIIDDSTITSTFKQIGPLQNKSKYFWRVSGKNISGYSPWSMARVFSTVEAPPTNAPILVAPLNNAARLETSLKFEWLKDSASAVYLLQVSMDSLFGKTFFEDSAITTNYRLVNNLNPDSKYFWRVQGRNKGGISPWSMVWNFKTLGITLAKPKLLSPTNGSVNVPISTILSWQSDTTSNFYRLQLSSDSLFAGLVKDDSIKGMNIKQVGPLDYDNWYYWRVASFVGSAQSPWSDIWKFKTNIISLPTPKLIAPDSNAQDLPTEVTLKWEMIPGALFYHLQFSNNAQFSNIFIEDSLITGDSRMVGPLKFNGKYFWRVRARNNSGVSLWSMVRNFSTGKGAPLAPILILPPVNATNLPVSLNLLWSKDSTVSTYHLQVSQDPMFSSTIFNDPLITNNSLTISSLMNGSRYYWRVKSKNPNGVSPWSMVSKFTTAYGAPMLMSPVNGATNQATSLILYWMKDSTAYAYHLQVSMDSMFTSFLINDSIQGGNSRALSGLNFASKYFWRVSSKRFDGKSPWSEVWNFMTVVPVLPTPVTMIPTNGDTNIPVTITLQWSAVDRMQNYHLQVAYDSLFGKMIFSDSLVSVNSKEIGPLFNGVMYYWRVRATNPGGSSMWSTLSRFKTLLALPPAPVLVSPPNNTTRRPLLTDLNWSFVPSAKSYRVQISNDSLFSTTAYDYKVPSIKVPIGPLNYNKTYFWRVASANDFGQGVYSEVWKFTTMLEPPAPVQLLNPVNGASGISTAVGLSWTSNSTAVSYWLQVASDPVFKNLFVDKVDLIGTSFNIINLAFNTTYHWRVKVLSNDGESEWSLVNNFTTVIGPPSAPVLNLPSNGATGIDINTIIRWSCFGNVNSYSLEVSTDPMFSTSIVYEPNYFLTTKELGGLSYNTTYYWRVKSRNAVGESDWIMSQFTTIAAQNERNDWTQSSSGIELGQINCIVRDMLFGGTYAGCDSGVYKAISAGLWEPYGDNWNELNLVNSMVVTRSGDLFAATKNGIWRKLLTESFWRQVYYIRASITLSIDNAGKLIGAYGQSLVISGDNGENWKLAPNLPLPDQCQYASVIHTAPNGNMYVGTTKIPERCPTGLVEVFVSSDNGINWMPTGFNNRDNAFGILAIQGSSKGELYAGTIGTAGTPGGLYRYNGSQWENTGLSGYRVTAIGITPSGEIYVAVISDSATGVKFKSMRSNRNIISQLNLIGKNGMTKSKDGGKTWEQANEGLVDTKVSTITITDDGKIIVGTVDGGIYEGTYANENQAPYFTTRIGDTTIFKSQTLDLTISAADLNKDKVSFTFTNLPALMSVDSISEYSRKMKWTPASTQVGMFNNIVVKVSDGSLSESASFNITVSGVNSQPQFVKILDDTVIKENQAVSVLINAVDADNDVLTFTSENMPANARLDYIDPSSRTFFWKPNFGETGVYRDIKITISDGILTNYKSFAITVKKDNRSPSSFTLISPSNNNSLQLSYPVKPIEFKWQNSSDPDIGDILSYRFYLKGLTLDTTIIGLTSSELTLNIMGRMKVSTEYRWYVISSDGLLYTVSDTFKIMTKANVVGVRKDAVIPTEYSLDQNYPNPFNPSTTIQFSIPKETPVKMEIYNILGQKVRTLVNNEIYAPGIWNVIWDGKDNRGISCATGIYFYRLEAGNYTNIKKMIMMK